MDSPAAIVIVIILGITLVGGAAMAQLAIEETGQQHEFTEDFNTTGTGSVVEFEHSHEPDVYYSDTVNVTNETGERMRAGIDYNWRTQNGTLEVLSEDLANNTGATIEYDYRDPTPAQEETADRLALIFQNAYALPLVAVFALVLLGISGLSSLT